jgi:hypothetical protein
VSGKKYTVYVPHQISVTAGEVYEFEIVGYDQRQSQSGRKYVNFYAVSATKISH